MAVSYTHLKRIYPAVIGLFNPVLILPDTKYFTNEEMEYI